MRTLTLACLLAFCAPAFADAPEHSPARKAFLSISKQELKAHVDFLASPELEGRDSGSQGAYRAGEYIARYFQKHGLEPVGDDKTYFQKFSLGETTGRGKTNTLVITVGDKQIAAEAEMFAPFPFSADGKATAEIVVAGYGINAPGEKYNDFAGIDCKGKIILIMRHEPRANLDGKRFAGKRNTRHSWFDRKMVRAQEAGAAGVLIVNCPAVMSGDKDVLFGSRGGSNKNNKIPTLHVKQAFADKILAASGKFASVKAWQEAIDKDVAPQSFASGIQATMAAELSRKEIIARNVIGAIRGTDPKLKDEIVVVGAHYDHIGRGYYGSRGGPKARGVVHPGADDNASGTAVVMAMAKAFHASGVKPRRTMVFMAFSGEERGLHGSRFYVNNPIAPIEKHAAMINMDMVGRNKPGEFHVNGIGSADIWEDVCKRLASGLGYTCKYGRSGFAPSDNAVFYEKKVPVLFLNSGLHADYHTPRDNAETQVSEQKEAIARYCYAVLHYLCYVLDKRPTVIVEARPTRGGQRRVRLGIVPDMGAQGVEGVRASGVQPGSPAEKGGMQAGDVIVGMAGKPVKNLRDLQAALVSSKPGDKVDVVVLRGDERKTLKVILGGR